MGHIPNINWLSWFIRSWKTHLLCGWLGASTSTLGQGHLSMSCQDLHPLLLFHPSDAVILHATGSWATDWEWRWELTPQIELRMQISWCLRTFPFHFPRHFPFFGPQPSKGCWEYWLRVSRTGHCHNLRQLHVLSRPDIRRSIGQLAECNCFQRFFPTYFWHLMQLAQIDGEKRRIRAMNALCQNQVDNEGCKRNMMKSLHTKNLIIFKAIWYYSY